MLEIEFDYWVRMEHEDSFGKESTITPIKGKRRLTRDFVEKLPPGVDPAKPELLIYHAGRPFSIIEYVPVCGGYAVFSLPALTLDPRFAQGR